MAQHPFHHLPGAGSILSRWRTALLLGVLAASPAIDGSMQHTSLAAEQEQPAELPAGPSQPDTTKGAPDLVGGASSTDGGRRSLARPPLQRDEEGDSDWEEFLGWLLGGDTSTTTGGKGDRGNDGGLQWTQFAPLRGGHDTPPTHARWAPLEGASRYRLRWQSTQTGSTLWESETTATETALPPSVWGAGEAAGSLRLSITALDSNGSQVASLESRHWLVDEAGMAARDEARAATEQACSAGSSVKGMACEDFRSLVLAGALTQLHQHDAAEAVTPDIEVTGRMWRFIRRRSKAPEAQPESNGRPPRRPEDWPAHVRNLGQTTLWIRTPR